MSDFALFTCRREEEQKEQHTNLLQYIYNLLRRRKAESRIEEIVESIELFDDVTMNIIKLPYAMEQMGEKLSKLSKIGVSLKERYGNMPWIIPASFAQLQPFEGCIRDASAGRTLFKSLLIEMVHEIYIKRNIEVSALDISIIHGNSLEEVRMVISQLAPHVKFLTVITDEKEGLEEEISQLYYDTGLAVRITNEFKSGMKNADLIINFSRDKEFVFNARINPRALIINYGGINPNKFLCENILINHIEVAIPQEIRLKAGQEIFRYYDGVEIAELILAHKTRTYDKIIEGIFNYQLAEELSAEFRKNGFAITTFAGRRNSFKPRDIRLGGAG